MASVFLSYDHKDFALASPIAAALEKAGHAVWWDQHITAGTEYNEEIENAVERAEAVVVLWSERSIRSAWVRDEAAEGRDQGKLVPVLLDRVKPPMGFRQYQTIDLSGWRGRGKAPVEPLLAAIAAQRGGAAEPPLKSGATRPLIANLLNSRVAMGAGIAAALLAASVGAWFLSKGDGLPAVAVAAADNSSASRALAKDMLVKFGSLAQLGSGKWQLVDNGGSKASSDLLFQPAATSSNGKSKASLMLLEGDDRSVIWSRDFEFPEGRSADLRQQVTLTAGGVLRCALEARAQGSISGDLLKLFLGGCADFAAAENSEAVATAMTKVVAQKPNFSGAWSRLLVVETEMLQDFNPANIEHQARRDVLVRHIREARKTNLALPEAYLADEQLLSPMEYGARLALIDKAKDAAPENPEVYGAEASRLLSVGRMSDAVDAARRAAKLDPLSPAPAMNLISILALSGRVDAARSELTRAERIWAGTEGLRRAQYMYHLRFGDPHIALRMAGEDGVNVSPTFIRYRLNPSRENAARLVEQAKQYAARAGRYPLEGLAEAHATDEAFALIATSPTRLVAQRSSMLFRPASKDMHRDRRFMQVAKRIGLLHYWRTSGHWPDFCQESDLPYDCKTEAAKLAAAAT